MANKEPKRFLVGFFDVPGFGPDSVETEIKGTPQEQYARLNTLIQEKHKKAKGITRVGSTAELRTAEEDGFIELPDGATISQVFDGIETTEAERHRTVGSVYVESSPQKIVLILNNDATVVRVQLTPVLKNIGNGITRFSNQINPTRLASELPQILKEVLGDNARNLNLRFRKPAKK